MPNSSFSMRKAHSASVNCTFVENEAKSQSSTGGYGAGGAIYQLGSATNIINSIFWNNTHDNFEVGTSQSQIVGLGAGGFTDPEEGVHYSCIQGGLSGPGNTNNISSDPLFVDINGGDLHLTHNSPCIDSGNNNALPLDNFDLDHNGNVIERLPLDLDINARVGIGPNQSGPARVDMGAYEVPSNIDDNPSRSGSKKGSPSPEIPR